MDGQNLSGQLSDWSIHDLLQIMHVTKKTGSLDISGERSGRIHFNQGAITGADITGAVEDFVADGRGGVADVLYVLSSIESGSFVVSTGEASEGDGDWSVDAILADVESLKNLESQVAESGLIEASAVRLKNEIDEAIGLEPEDWQMIVSLVQPFNFDQLESRFGRGGAVRLLHALHRLDVAEEIQSEDESEWLDQVADRLSADAPNLTGLTATDPEPESLAAVVPLVDASSDDHEADDDPRRVELESVVKVGSHSAGVKGVSAPASTTLTDGVYDEIRRLRSKVSEK